MTELTDEQRTIGTSAFVLVMADKIRHDPLFNNKIAGAMMLKHGFALLYDIPAHEADQALQRMLAAYDAGFFRTKRGIK